MTSLSNEQPLAETATADVFARENALLRQRNAQLEASLNAIRDGEMDALLIAEKGSDRLLTLGGTGHAYRLLVEEMGEGAITLTPKGVVAYANRRFAEMLGRPLQRVIGSRIEDCVAPEGRQAVSALLKDGPTSKRSSEVDLLMEAGDKLPALLSVRRLILDGMPDALCMVVTDLTAQKLSEAAIETRQTLLQLVEQIRDNEVFVTSVIDSLRARIAVIDVNGAIITVNDAWRRFAVANGPPGSDRVAVGADYFEICGALPALPNSAGDSALSEEVREVLTGSRPNLSLEYVCHSPTAQQWFVLNVLPLQGATKGAVMIHHDITERKLGEQALERMREAELRFKTEFLSHVSHELRSPLTAIKQFTSILVRGTSGHLNTEQRQYANIVLKNVGQLQSMIDDLLEVTRLESGKITVDPAPVSVAVVASDAINTLDMTARAKGIFMSCELPEDLPPAYADPVRLLQILIILLDNAVKFTPSGGCVSITGAVPADEPQALLLEVRDTGCGINPDNAAKLFDRLYQDVRTNAESRTGLGLGLYICKELVKRQGGRIWLTSKPGAGSTFSFTLPQFRSAASLATIPAPAVDTDLP